MKALLVLLAVLTACAAAERPRVVIVARSSQVLPQLVRDFPHSCDCLLTGEDVGPQRLAEADVVFVEHPSAAFLSRHKKSVQQAVGRGLRVITDVPDIVQRGWGIELSPALARRVLPYWQNGGAENLTSFLVILWQEAGGDKTVAVPPPFESPRQGVYHPDAPKLFQTLTDYLDWYRKAKPGKGALATVNFFHTYLKNGDLAVIDSLLRELETQGLAAGGVVGWPHHTLQTVFQTPPGDPVRVMLSFTLSLSRPEDRSVLERQNVHVIGLTTTRDSYEQWARSERGISPERVASSLAEPERNGATETILVGTTETSASGGAAVTTPIPERVRMAALRARRWVTLSAKPNHEKRLVMLYYNNPPGKGNLGASYMNLPPSIVAVLKTLREERYFTGDRLPTREQVLDQLERVGRNVGEWAPGELRRMLEQGGMTLLPVAEYRKWFDELPEQFRTLVNTRWGKPEDSTLMTWNSASGEKFFIVPGVRLGNVFLGPQLLRSSFTEYTNVQHSSTLPPHHAYVASYLWYRHHFHADAVIHMGRHGTLEWLPGKNAGQAAWDCSEVILGDLPNLNYYIADGGGEAVQARRRSAAVDISHLTPLLAMTGEEARLKPLADALEQWADAKDTSPMLATEYASKAVAEARRLDLGRQLALDLTKPDLALPRLAQFIDALHDELIPLGLPTLGEMPETDRQVEGLAAFLGRSFSDDEARLVRPMLASWSRAIAEGRSPDVARELPASVREKVFRVIDEGHGWIVRLRESPERELKAVVRVLRGEFLPSGIVGDAIAVPDSIPTGRNLHQGDPALLPTRAAWDVGKKLAQQLLEEHRQRHGAWPERISMILWSGETGRHEGAMEAQALYLMGVEPQWNARGIVDGLQIIPEETLGRPRVNVVFTVSGLYRDSFADKILLLDRAARLAASAGENAISRQNREVERALISAGVTASEAKELSGARVFASAPGAYGFGLSAMVEQSRDKDEPETMARLYLSKMNYAFTEKRWGVTVPKLLENQLRGNQTILHSRSSNLYGAVDNDDVYQYMGGLRIASEAAGAKPELLVNNLRKAGREKIEDARTFIATELNVRNWNPKWIAEMQKEGYSGAREMAKAVEYLYGWQATAPETISPSVWQKMHDVYVKDEYGLGLKEFLEKENPAARQNIIGRLLEVDRQGSWQFSAADRRTMLREFVQLTARHGVTCSANMCGNRKLQQEVLRSAASVTDAAELARFREQVADALSPTPARESVPSRVSSVAPRVSKSRGLPTQVDGWRVTYVDVQKSVAAVREFVVAHAFWVLCGWLAFVAACVWLVGTRRRAGSIVSLRL